MSEKESLNFTKLSKYPHLLLLIQRDDMIWFVTGVSDAIEEECHAQCSMATWTSHG